MKDNSLIESIKTDGTPRLTHFRDDTDVISGELPLMTETFIYHHTFYLERTHSKRQFLHGVSQVEWKWRRNSLQRQLSNGVHQHRWNRERNSFLNNSPVESKLMEVLER